MSVTFAELGDLRVGSYLIIDGEPCRVVEISKAKTGKHGSAKAHVVAISIISGVKKTLVAPVDTRVEVPIIDKRVGQVLAVSEKNIQIMDMESFETFEAEPPKDEDLLRRIAPGKEVEYWVIMGKRIVVNVRG
ncbi:translation initiation factor IF-5A [Desulfurococcaceae archaeon AG1]|nr:MAG: translation initiation factor IF-5A [Desulfurococcaceae archaeon]GAY25416.1 translation initiation factor IF-5A [Desulfurococcaceae archaeon AG1]